jgi:hypothetical protein
MRSIGLKVALAVAMAVLCGCAADLSKPMSSDLASALRNGRVTVVFHDVPQRIHYIDDRYWLLAVTTEESDSDYAGIWQSDKDLTALDVAEFNRLGLHATSLFDLIPEDTASRLVSEAQSVFVVTPHAKPTLPSTTPASEDLCKALLEKNQDFLIWASWDGLHVHDTTLGLPNYEYAATYYHVLDLRRNKVVALGTVYLKEHLDLDGKTLKQYFEADHLAGLKAQAQRMIHDRFVNSDGTGVRASVGQALGLEAQQ